MKIRRFNENTESDDFISIEEVKEIIAHLYDIHNLDIEISSKWVSKGGTELYLSATKEYDSDVQVISVSATLDAESQLRFGVDYGIDSYSIGSSDLSTVNNIITEIIDASKHFEAEGYDLTTEIYNYQFLLTVSKKGSLL